jgi:TetR/AcrR family transcriptional regulator
MISSKTPASEARRPGSSSRTNVGRPKKRDEGGKIVHDALLVATDECVVTESSTRVPVREIAAKAGVNQAMVNYYFASKSGMISVLFEKHFSQLVRDLDTFLKIIVNSPDSEAPDRDYIADLIALIEDSFSRSPALFVIMHSDMLDNSSETRKSYTDRFGAQGYSMIARIMKALMERGHCRSDISPEHASYFICSMSAMPYLVSPIFEKAFASKKDGEIAERRRRAAAQVLQLPQPGGQVAAE